MLPEQPESFDEAIWGSFCFYFWPVAFADPKGVGIGRRRARGGWGVLGGGGRGDLEMEGGGGGMSKLNRTEGPGCRLK